MPINKSIHEKLTELAWNLWWSWQPDVTSIFREIDPPLWSELGHNPILLLRQYPPEKLEIRARDAVLHSRIHGAYRRWNEYLASTETWGDTHASVLGHRPVAYFSAEFGMHESLRLAKANALSEIDRNTLASTDMPARAISYLCGPQGKGFHGREVDLAALLPAICE